MSEEALLHDLLYYRVKDYEVQKRHIPRDFAVPHDHGVPGLHRPGDPAQADRS